MGDDGRKQWIAGMFDRASDTYDDVGVRFFAVFGRRLVELADVAPGMDVLDVGTGRGAVLFPAAAAVTRTGTVTAIDLAEGMVRRTAADARAEGLHHVDVQLGDAESPDFGAGSFDRVLSSLVIFFLPDPAKALSAYHRLLRPGGRLGLTTFGVDDDKPWQPVMERMRSFLPPGAPLPGEGPVGTPDKLDALLRAAGFTAIEAVEEQHVTVLKDAEQWWRFSWSAGLRASLERIPAEDLDSVKREILELVEGIRDGTGQLTFRSALRYTLATKP
jgi:ubiquinone/menaquinone biosynthesis C-methylase UbiE